MRNVRSWLNTLSLSRYLSSGTKSSLKIVTANAICWNSLGLFWDYGLNYTFSRNKTFFSFQDRKLKFSASAWKRYSWHLKKYQLNQITDRKNRNNSCLNELNDLKFCDVSQYSFSNRCWKFQLSILKKQKKVLFL